MNRFLTFYYQRIKPKFLENPLYSEASDNPFFILSAGRSGSTLLRKLLLINTAVNIPPESDDLIPKLAKFYLRNNHKSWENIVDGCIEIFKNEEATGFWNLKLNSKELLELCEKDRSLAGIISGFYNLYSNANNFENIQWGDKTPFLLFRLSWLKLIYPNARFVFLIRDGRAVVNSYLKMNSNYSIDKAIERYKNSIKIISHQIGMKRSRCLIIKYEELIINPEENLNLIYDFLKISRLPTKKTEVFMGDDGLPHHRNIHSDILIDCLDKWKVELGKKDIEYITNKISKELSKFAYPI